ncbi:MAG: TadE family protein [Planctomycetota bacterium]
MIRISKRRAARNRRTRRLGVEIVELAFALPVMTIIIFGTLETCELLFTKQSLAVAAYEAGRVAARPEGTAAAAQTRFDQIMTARRVSGANLTITPADLGALATGETIRLEATAPVSGNNSTNLVLSGVPDIIEAVVVVRE